MLQVDKAGFRTDFLIANGYNYGLGSTYEVCTQYWTRFADNNRGVFYIESVSYGVRYEGANASYILPVRPMIDVMIGDTYED